jgi:hypothetical protein
MTEPRQTLDDAARMDAALERRRARRALEQLGQKPAPDLAPAERERRRKARRAARAARRRNRR